MYWKTLKFTSETMQNNNAVVQQFQKKMIEKHIELGIDVEKWQLFRDEIQSELGLNLVITIENEQIAITEEGYVEPTPDPMATYLQEQDNFIGVKTAYELGLVEEEEYQCCCDYMRAVYPSEIKPLSRLRRPEVMDKFRTGR